MRAYNPLSVDELGRNIARALNEHIPVGDAEDALLPLSEMDGDPVWRESDAAVVSALGLDGETAAAIRRSLAAEPSVTGRRYGRQG